MSRRVIRWLGCLSAAVVVLLAVAVAAGIHCLPESSPAAQPQAALQVGDVGASQRLLQRDELRRAFNGQTVEVSLGAQELNTLLHDMALRLLGGSAQVSWSGSKQAQVVVSVPMGRTPLKSLARWGNWLNVRATFAARPEGIPSLTTLRVGQLPVPAWVGLWAARHMAERYQLVEPADILLSSVDQVAIEGQSVRVRLTWRGDLNARALNLLIPLDDQERLLVYQQQLAGLMHSAPAVNGQEPDIPLLEVMRPMFEQARQRSLVRSLDSSSPGAAVTAARENRAVLLVLALHAGKVPVARLIPQAKDWPPTRQRALALHSRIDFAQHFLLSALLATDVGGRMADVVGIYKEMLDTHQARTGSGFSFNDIAADRAGVRFGQRAKQDPIELQTRMTEAVNDGFVMPEVDDLPQYLSEETFKRLYGQVGSSAYVAVMKEIERRVNELPVLR